MDYELAIIGAGPAGLTAGIYATRSGIKTIIFDKEEGGGTANLAPKIENYPGFKSINGTELMQKMKEHTEEYIDIHTQEEVKQINKKDEKILIQTSKNEYTVKTIILATGTKHRRLNAPGEEKLQGKGISYCATCDGFFFKDKKVAVIGGGNSALIEAIYLKQIGCKKVHLIHRRDQLRGEKAYEKEAKEKDVNFLLNTIVKKINGDQKVEKLDLENTKTGKTTQLDVDGVFISIGEEPQNYLAQQLGLTLNDQGYVMVDEKQKTSMEKIFAAGDITGGVKQVITACAQGALAGLNATEPLGKKYPY